MNMILRWYRQLKHYQKVGLLTGVVAVVPAVIYQAALHDWKQALVAVWLCVIACGAVYASNGWMDDV